MGLFSFIKEAGEKLFGHKEAEQADHPGLHQVIDVDRGRQPRKQMVRDTPDQRTVLLDQLAGIGFFSGARVHHNAVHWLAQPGTAEPSSCSTKNSRCPLALAGNGRRSMRVASSRNAIAARERGAPSTTGRWRCIHLRTMSS